MPVMQNLLALVRKHSGIEFPDTAGKVSPLPCCYFISLSFGRSVNRLINSGNNRNFWFYPPRMELCFIYLRIAYFNFYRQRPYVVARSAYFAFNLAWFTRQFTANTTKPSRLYYWCCYRLLSPMECFLVV